MNQVILKFEGDAGEEVAQRFYTWLVDGGLEDQVVDTLSSEKVEVAMSNWDNDQKIVSFTCTDAGGSAHVAR